MRLSAIPYYSCILLFCSLCTSIRAQPTGKDSLLTTPGAYYNALQVYHGYLNPETGLYRGAEYIQYAYTLKDGHPYFDDGHMQKGTVLYNGILYENLPLLYDLVKGQVVIDDSYNNYTIFLINTQVDYFTIRQHLFINFKDSLNPSAPHWGYYEELYKDRIGLYKKEKKVIEEDISSGKLERNIEPSVSYYLKKGSTWYAVNNKRSLLYAMEDKRREAKKFIRKNGLNVRKDKENTLLKVTAWYNGETSTTANK